MANYDAQVPGLEGLFEDDPRLQFERNLDDPGMGMKLINFIKAASTPSPDAANAQIMGEWNPFTGADTTGPVERAADLQTPSLERLMEANITNKPLKEARGEYDNPNAPPPPDPTGGVGAAAYKEGWRAAPGTQSFMKPGEVGRYRYTGTPGTPDEAAASLRAFNQRKYGGSGRYGGAGAEVLNPAETIAELGRSTFAAGQEKRLREAGDLASLREMIRRGTLAGQDTSQLQTQYKTLAGMLSGATQAAEGALDETTGIAPGLLKPLEEMAAAQRQREEYGQLAQMLGGGQSVGKAFPGGMSKETYGRIGEVRKAQNEERRLDNADRTFNRLTQNDAARAAKVPAPSAAMVAAQAKSMLPPGTAIARIGGQDVLVKAGTTTPVPDGDRKMKAAWQQAYAKLTGGGARPDITQHPSIQGIAQMEKIVQTQGGPNALRPDQRIIYDRFHQSRVAMKNDFMAKGMPEREAAALALKEAAAQVVGLR